MVTSNDGTKIAVDTAGTGPAVVCVGGGLNNRFSTAPVAAAIAGRTVHSYDRRGRGDSGDTRPYAVEREIEDLAAVIDHAGGTAMVYGMSSGAVLALRAAMAGVPITRLALYEPPLNAPAGPPNYTERLAAATPEEALELFLSGVMRMPEATLAGMRQSPMWPDLVALAPTLRYDNDILGDGRIPPVGELTTPTTVIAGAESPAWMRETAATLAEALPNGALTILPNQTHNVDPAVLGEALTKTFT